MTNEVFKIAIIVAALIPAVVLLVSGVWAMVVDLYERYTEWRTIRQIKKMPYNKVERVLNSKEQKEITKAIADAIEDLRHSEREVDETELKSIILHYEQEKPQTD